MGHYTANLRDIEFCLFDLLGRENILGSSVYKDLDRETVMGMLEEIKRLAENDLAASFVEGDRVGVNFDASTGDVKLPASFIKSFISVAPASTAFSSNSLTALAGLWITSPAAIWLMSKSGRSCMVGMGKCAD